MKQNQEQELLRMAFEARDYAYCPYSGFSVGAALLADDGTIYTGCNIENASYGVTNCAERTALFKAVSEGHTVFRAIAIVGGKKESREGETDYCPPCGVCRQALAEFCAHDLKVIIGRSKEEYEVYLLEDILPYSFGKNMIKKDKL